MDARRAASRFPTVLLLLAAACVIPGAARAQGLYTTVHHFHQGPRGVMGRLIQAADGNIYGTASEGGRYAGGVIYVMRRASDGMWQPPATLHDFQLSEGIKPLAGLIESAPGILYGTTSQGGAYGGGTLFRVAVTGQFQLLRALNPPTDGSGSSAELTKHPNGAFYGTAAAGGRFGLGTVFRITTGGAFSVIHSFSDQTGRHPAGAMAIGPDGNLYGTTRDGGPYLFGSAFRLSPAGALATIYVFVPQPPYFLFGFGKPAGPLVLGPDGALYGLVTSQSFVFENRYEGGAFRMTTAGAVSAVFPTASGKTPVGGLTVGPDGWLYGLTNDSRIYRVRQPPFTFEWIFDPVVDLGIGSNAGGPLLLANDGRMYGATSHDSWTGSGFIFSIDLATPAAETLHSFAGDGFTPVGDLLKSPDGNLYGTTYRGGSVDLGTVFRVSPSGAVSRLANSAADPPIAQNVLGGVMELRNGNLMASGRGALFDVSKAGETTLWAAVPVNSGCVEGSDGRIYGTVSQSGGTIRRFAPFSEDVLHQFTGADGSRPVGGLRLAADGFLYGTTAEGGAHGYGTVFRFGFDGTLTTLHEFAGVDGAAPTATLVEGPDGLLYGTTLLGGDTSIATEGGGTIFKIGKDGSGFTSLHAFTGSDGLLPFAGLTLGSDGHFYGTALIGGLGTGTVFVMDGDGAFAVLHRFGPGEGAYPLAGVTESNGALWGTTARGGSANAGVVYRIGPG